MDVELRSVMSLASLKAATALPDAWHIPRLWHHIWLDDPSVPAAWVDNQAAWQQTLVTQGWTYKLWHEATAQAFLERGWPWLMPLYRRLPLAIQRSHLLRYVVLYEEGGVYADLNLEAVPEVVPDLLAWLSVTRGAVLLADGATHFLALTPRHPWLRHVLLALSDQPDTWWGAVASRFSRHYQVNTSVGAWFLQQCQQTYQPPETVPPLVVLPQAWIGPSGSHTSLTRMALGPHWQEWDSTAAQYLNQGWDQREWLWLGLLVLLLGILLWQWLRAHL